MATSSLGPSALEPEHSDRIDHNHHLLSAPSSHSLHLSADGSDQFRLHNDVDGKDVALDERQKAFAKEVSAR